MTRPPVWRRLVPGLALALIPLVSAQARLIDVGENYNSGDRIRDITTGPAAGMYAAGWALMVLGLLVGTGWEQLRVLRGETPRHGAVVVRAVVAAAALAAYGPFCNGVWNLTAELGHTICTEHEVDLLALGMKTLLLQAYTALQVDHVVFAPVSIIRNGILGVMITALGWFVVFAVDAIQTAQVVIFNVVFAFGPICLGLHVMGLRTGELLLTALLEICSWTVTIAMVATTLRYRIEAEVLSLAAQHALQTDWWRDMQELTFLASLILFVPPLTSRFFGMSALGELSRASLGSHMTMEVANAYASFGGFSSAPSLRGSQSPDSDSGRRAGD